LLDEANNCFLMTQVNRFAKYFLNQTQSYQQGVCYYVDILSIINYGGNNYYCMSCNIISKSTLC